MWFAVEGELDVGTAGAVGADLARRLADLAPGAPDVLDLRSTRYLASAGVGMVLQALARAGETGVSLRVQTQQGTPPARILTLAGLGELAGSVLPPSA